MHSCTWLFLFASLYSVLTEIAQMEVQQYNNTLPKRKRIETRGLKPLERDSCHPEYIDSCFRDANSPSGTLNCIKDFITHHSKDESCDIECLNIIKVLGETGHTEARKLSEELSSMNEGLGIENSVAKSCRRATLRDAYICVDALTATKYERSVNKIFESNGNFVQKCCVISWAKNCVLNAVCKKCGKQITSLESACFDLLLRELLPSINCDGQQEPCERCVEPLFPGFDHPMYEKSNISCFNTGAKNDCFIVLFSIIFLIHFFTLRLFL